MWVTSGLFCGSVGQQVRPTFNPDSHCTQAKKSHHISTQLVRKKHMRKLDHQMGSNEVLLTVLEKLK